MKVLVTCPPMLRNLDEFRPRFHQRGVTLEAPKVVQTLTEPELIALVPGCDGWIIGDDPATRNVFAAGKAGKLRAEKKKARKRAGRILPQKTRGLKNQPRKHQRPSNRRSKN